jgi:DNA replication protein DnaC
MEEIMQTISLKTGKVPDLQYNPQKLEELKVKSYNKSVGSMQHYDCEKCKNKGDIAYINDDGVFALKSCDCQNIRKSNERIAKSGLADLIKKYTFDRYTTTEKWQESIKASAKAFVDDTYGNWFFIGGQVGSGKTMICTSIAAELLSQGKKTAYMLWRDEIVPLKANVNDFEEYESRINYFKTVPVLYIDDFFKVEKGKMPTSADVNIAFELLNYRYNDPELTTIISSEFTTKDIINIDEAVGSRIYERSKKYQININADIKKNYRLR